jgi:hypothetical protein
MSDDGHDSMTPSERRIGVRHFACFPAHVEPTGGARRSAMMHDLSKSGASLVVSTLLKVDDRISLTLYVKGDPDSPSQVTPARVVRVEPLPPEARGLWTHRIAVQFDEPLEGFDDEIKALAERQRKLGLKP